MRLTPFVGCRSGKQRVKMTALVHGGRLRVLMPGFRLLEAEDVVVRVLCGVYHAELLDWNAKALLTSSTLLRGAYLAKACAIYEVNVEVL